MTREQMIEKAAQAIHDYHGCTDSCEFRGCDLDPERAVASAVVDALLPHVTTVEELGQRPRGDILVSPDGITASAASWWLAESQGMTIPWPLTVAWQP